MKTRILAIVPYIGMKELMTDIAAERDDIALTVHVGTLKEGLEIVQSYNLDNFDIIAARGGTAKMLAENVNIPVTEIEISAYDILRAIKLAENYTSRFAIVGISAITKNAILLRNLLQYDIKIVTLVDSVADRKAFVELADEGYEMVLCDMRNSLTAYELGMNYILLTSGRESIESAFQQAINTARLYSFYRRQAKLFRGSFSSSGESLFVYDKNRSLIFKSLERDEETDWIFHIIEQNLAAFFSDASFRLEERSKDQILSCHCNHVVIDEMLYVYIYLRRQNAPAPMEDLGISVYKNTENLNWDSDFYGSANLVGNNRKALEAYSKTLLPILLLGEQGTGKDKCATFLYRHSEYKNLPYFIIDCENTGQKKWNYFMESPNSPLNDIHSTIYVKNLQKLRGTVEDKFLPYIKQNDLCRRNRFIFSFTLSSESAEDHPLCQYLMNALSCLVLKLPSLRERTEDLPSIVTLYISQVNIELGKQVVGFEPGAMTVIQEFDWPQNLSQLKRIIRQLIVLTEGDYISSDLVKETLKQESPKVTESLRPGYEIINTNQTLSDIDYDIVRMVLKQENMNRSKVVERLGISRTTLWRMLQR